MIRISKELVTYVLGETSEPVIALDLPAGVIIETQDCYGGIIKTGEDTVEKVEIDCINPATGPLYFNGLRPGDILKITIVNIKVNSPGFVMAVPKEGVIGHKILQPVTKILPFDDEYAYFDKYKFPVCPMIGVIGVAPPGDPQPTLIPGDHGGNMDTTLLKKGSVLFLPVFKPGGWLSVGDLHAVMGDGESMFSGLEAAGEVTLEIESYTKYKFKVPYVLSDGSLSVIISADSMETAFCRAMEEMVEFLTEYSDLNLYDAGFICGLYGNLEVSQVIDPLKTARMSIPLTILTQLGIEL